MSTDLCARRSPGPICPVLGLLFWGLVGRVSECAFPPRIRASCMRQLHNPKRVPHACPLRAESCMDRGQEDPRHVYTHIILRRDRAPRKWGRPGNVLVHKISPLQEALNEGRRYRDVWRWCSGGFVPPPLYIVCSCRGKDHMHSDRSWAVFGFDGIPMRLRKEQESRKKTYSPPPQTDFRDLILLAPRIHTFWIVP